MKKRLFAAFVCLCMIVSLLPTMAFAEAGVQDSGIVTSASGLCEHHTQHDESCGYTERTEEIPCSHEHNENCGGLTDPEACNHSHDEACGYVSATEGTPCTFVCEVCNPQDSGNPATPSDAQPEECTCETLCTEEEINGDCPVCSAEGAELDKVCVGVAPMLPVTAEAAAEGAPSSLYVGNYQITNSNTPTYLKAGSTQGSLEEGSETDWTVKYDPSTATLTLSGATIKGGSDVVSIPYGSGIYAQGSSNQPVTLTIELIGENTITGTFGIYVNAEINASSYGTNATLTIMGENNGSLEVSGSNNGIYVKSGTGNASLNIKNVAVTSSTNDNYAAGVYVMSSMHATSSPQLSLKVNGGSLTASGTGSSDGILFYVGSSQATGATTRLTVSENAIVDAKNGGISALKISETLPTPTPTGDNRSGIVFDGSTGTVYGTVALQNDLTIGEGESLTVPNGSSLNGNGKLTNNGTIIVEKGGNLTGNPGGIIVTAPAITTDSLPNGTVGESYTATLEATGNNITWSASGLPDGLTLNSDGTITGTPTAEGTSTVTVKAENSAGSTSKDYTLNIKPATVPVTGLELNKKSLTLQEKDSDTLTVTVKPADATNQDVTWQSSNTSIATVSADGTVTAISAGTATITATAADGSGISASCNLTVTHGNMIQTPKKDATCTLDGTEEYWTCEICGKHYKDESGTVPTTPEKNVIPKTGHAWGEAVYTWSDDGKTCTATRTCSTDGTHIEKADAVVTSEQTKAPTCTDPGETTYTATFDNDWAEKQTKTVADIASSGHSWGDDGHCTVCGAVGSDFVPEIIAGANATWHKGSGKDFSFTSNAAHGDFLKVLVDGEELDASNYAVEPGSTVVALKASYLETLSVGKHTLGIVSDTGTAETEFTVAADGQAADDEAADDGGKEPLAKTGDGSMLPIAALSVIAAVAAAAGAFSLRRIRL